MRRMPFEPPTDYYDEKIKDIDEKICELIKERKEISNDNPGFPKKQLIALWSEKYNLDEDFLNSVFSNFFHYDLFKSFVEPTDFQKNIPVMQSFDRDGIFYSIPFIRQFANASVVHFCVDKNTYDQPYEELREHDFTFLDLSIEDDDVNYECRQEGGGGSGGHRSYTFIVSPPLPDDLSNIRFLFAEYKTPMKTKPTGVEFVMTVDRKV